MSPASSAFDAQERRPRILICDDEPANLEVLFHTLTDDGEVEIIAANRGAMVLELAHEERPDLVLLDAVMPEMGGFAVCRALKASAFTADIPVIFITSLAETSYKVDAFQAGAVDFITKPFDRVELLARVQTHLTLQRTRKALERRTEELGQTNARLTAELEERARAEEAKVALQEEVIRVQRERLLELSTPLIPITESILAIPLIGTLDAERAQRVITTALDGASQSRAEFVIVDVTGVTAASADVALMFTRLADSLRLLGRRVLITGISPAMARTLVRLHIALDGLETSATLESGIRLALEASHAPGWKGRSAPP